MGTRYKRALAGTRQGRGHLNRLINSPYVYTIKTTAFTAASDYDGLGIRRTARSIRYVPSPWAVTYWVLGDDGAMNGRLILGHEVDHAYGHDNGADQYDSYGNENSAVKFGNYLRSVYGDTPLRTEYKPHKFKLRDRESVYNKNQEKN